MQGFGRRQPKWSGEKKKRRLKSNDQEKQKKQKKNQPGDNCTLEVKGGEVF